MKIKSTQVPMICKKLVVELASKNAIKLLHSERDVSERMEALVLKAFQADTDLDEKAKKLLNQYADQLGLSGLDQQKALEKIKEKLKQGLMS